MNWKQIFCCHKYKVKSVPATGDYVNGICKKCGKEQRFQWFFRERNHEDGLEEKINDAMEKPRLRVAFDVDDTLLIPSVAGDFGRDAPNYETIAVYKWFQAQGAYMIIWSGSGVDWAKTWSEKLGLNADEFPMKGSVLVDLCFDDCNVDLGTVNVKVKRLNNSISRKEWNQNKKV